MTAIIKTPEEIEKMRVAGKMAAEVLEMIGPFVKKGVTTETLDRICHEYITEKLKAYPAPLNYHGFPKSICTSVNHVVCHGIPAEKTLKDGDIINIDVTVRYDENSPDDKHINGYHGDTSKMFLVGPSSLKTRLAERLMQNTQECLYLAIDMVKPGVYLGDIGHAIQKHAEAEGFSIVREYCGHGIGQDFHEDPQVLHYGKPGTGPVLEAGMCLTIEPMVNAGKRQTKLLKDDWTVITKDRSLSAQWEHTLLVTETGCEILTLREEETIPRIR
ncbi:type I methionyl aminopeptidase [Catenovulum sp. 2E275]|uniref:type I methionyl aminopeptidase n=1 Tax=Catenovulum sp. 2E275 TaxID=2980497 RepID=UPI0021D3E166|nr:type I methionyl aminopeptidase [Catenovulum sp. 2E275]MCU4675745.1 type I methionyl aminopeptidase [Catenovulum sp. 2E275]